MSGDSSQGDKTQCNGVKKHRYAFGFMGIGFLSHFNMSSFYTEDKKGQFIVFSDDYYC